MIHSIAEEIATRMFSLQVTAKLRRMRRSLLTGHGSEGCI
jgi:hypothetical protein